MANDFSNLPQELHIQIFSNLDAVSLIRCAMVSKSLYEVFKSSSLLTCIIQLHLDGLKDAGTSIAYPEFIRSLVQRRQAWLALEMKEPLTRHTQHECQAYELVGGVFANTSKLSSTHKDRLEVIWLPTRDNAKGRTLQRPSIEISVRDFAMDPTQDLIILLQDDIGIPLLTNNARTIPIHIHTISGINEIHPLAQQSPLQFTVLARRMYETAINKPILQVARNTLALCLHTLSWREQRVLIWDWTTSELILDSAISFDPILTSLKYTFGLLDSTYCFTSCASDCGSIRLYKLVRSHAVTTPAAVHLATLHLPPTSPGTAILSIESRSGPIEANSLPHASFMINDDDRLHVFTVIYKHESDRERISSLPVALFLHQRVLAKYAHQALGAHLPLDISWSEWGPPNTMFTCPGTEYASYWFGTRYIHAQRAVYPGGLIGDDSHMSDPSRYVEVLDFSRAAVLSAKGVLPMAPPSTSNSITRTLSPSRTIRKEDVPFFLDDVETHLPCVISTVDLKRTYESYMIHSDGIVGANIKDNGNFHLHMYTV